ncbi:hypothetical protein SAMN05421821_101363 [Mucilaginibacter lappiensis]|uniref:Uncharacterized protein n=1 Tax=Mucilaginibacter lappiensis TaxID=354630 RepID=A0ABR6PDD5_9SPHI|nr:hypothetical protein [Mucilaginibacter lappiensis]MBB6107721.1 hypothetical protein [Mucilaginibacter lappiensis]SIP99234.1 hypothetical protein SAMN05421821_101363 [Mucilaginibacter lappiensis]
MEFAGRLGTSANGNIRNILIKKPFKHHSYKEYDVNNTVSGTILDILKHGQDIMKGRGSKLSDTEIVQLVRLAGQAGAEALYDRYSAALFLSIIRIISKKNRQRIFLYKLL